MHDSFIRLVYPSTKEEVGMGPFDARVGNVRDVSPCMEQRQPRDAMQGMEPSRERE